MNTRDNEGEAALPDEREQLLALLLQEEGFAYQRSDAISPRPDASDAPLSFGQERLWFLDQWQPGTPTYNVPTALRFRCPLDVAALEASLADVVQRHEVLRSAFVNVDGRPCQVIAPSLQVPLRVLELSAVPATERNTAVEQSATQELRMPFDLTQAPLLRALLLRLNPQEHVLLLTLHHIIADGWSLDILHRDLLTLYAARIHAQQNPLPPLPIQYADYARWQRDPATTARGERELAAWTAHLAGAPTLLDMPTDFPRPPIQGIAGAVHRFRLPASLSQQIQTFSRQQAATPFQVLLAAFATLLSRYSGQKDLLIGTPVAGRTRPETEDLIGFFINTLVLRLELDSDPSFTEAVSRTRQEALAALDHQTVPFERLVAALQPDRTVSHTPLVQVFFELHSAAQSPFAIPGVTREPLTMASGTAKVDLTLLMWDEAGEYVGWLEYRTDLFQAETIVRLADHFQTLLAGALADPARRLSTLPLLTPAEREQILVAWNAENDSTAKPRHCIHELVEEQAARTPDAIAVDYVGERLTYGELDRQATQLAHHLRSLGVGPEVRVGLCLERSAQLVVGLLAILKAGGAYVPLDPDYPSERLALMLHDAGIPLLITQRYLLDHFPEQAVRQVALVCLDSDWDTISQQRTTALVSGVTPDNLAFVIYTSGSTGRPKGIAIPHHAVPRLVLNGSYIQIGPDDRIAQAANTSFDAATFEIWGALLCGARIVGIPLDTLLSATALHATLRERGITTMFLTTALFNRIAYDLPSAFESLSTLLFGGEASDPGSVARVLRHGAPRRLLHVYGPTEATTFASWFHVREVARDSTTIPIGFPLTDTQLYVLDTSMQPAPVGVPGELFIGGIGLARGYLDRPELTAESFVPHPHSQLSGERLYRTGDMVRHLPDGAIEFLGRRDNQIKLRGFRVEPGEIEAVLAQHSAVRASVVYLREDAPGKKTLVAYVVARSYDVSLSSSMLRDFLKERLPSYMLPTHIIVLEKLPITPNGKVDRHALPAPNDIGATAENGHVAPRTPVEEALMRIWVEVLSTDRIGVYDNFFDSGGHSLLATRVVARIRDVFHVDFPLRTLFEKPTIAEIAARIEGGQQELARSAVNEGMLAPIQAIPRGGGALDQLLAELEQLPEEDVRTLLAAEAPRRQEGPDDE